MVYVPGRSFPTLPSLMTPRAILFDLDGTLVDTITLYQEAVLQSLKEFGMEATRKEFHKWYVTPMHLGQILALYGETEDKVPAIRARRDEIYIDLLGKQTDWFPGAKELLEELTKRKIPLGLVTGSWMSYVDQIDSRLKVKKYFPVIVTADEIHRFMKPHPHGLLLAADRMQVDPKECIYVGDQNFDREAANAAGMQSVMIASEWSPKNLLPPLGQLEDVLRMLHEK